MRMRNLSFTTFNLYNLNEPGIRMYNNRDGWTQQEYDRKIDWTVRILQTLQADVFGFQELWHRQSLDVSLQRAGLADDYTPLVPPGQSGSHIVCAAAVRKDLLVGEAEWIVDFPDHFILESGGDDPQATDIKVEIDTFSRPVLHFRIRPRTDQPVVHVFVCHFKSKGPTRIFREGWYRDNDDLYRNHTEAIGSALSTIRRTAEATALRMILNDIMKDNNVPVVVMGDINDGQLSNTLNILTGQPRFLSGLSKGGGDTDLYTAQTLQEYRSRRDVYYTHIFQNIRESLDHILVSQEFYDNSRNRIWAFDGMSVNNDHLNFDDHKESGTNDHGIVRTEFRYRPAKKDLVS